MADFSFDADATYDDNFLMSDTEQESWIYSVKPEVSLIYLTPVMTSELDAKLAVKRYSEFDQFDSEDPAFSWKNSYKRARSTWSMDFGYRESSQRDFAEKIPASLIQTPLSKQSMWTPAWCFVSLKKTILAYLLVTPSATMMRMIFQIMRMKQ